MKKKMADLKKERIGIFGNNYMNDKKSFIQKEKRSIWKIKLVLYENKIQVI